MLSGYYLVSLIAAGSKLALCAMLLLFKLPHRPEFQKFRTVQYYLAVACLLLFVSNVTAPFTQDDEGPLGSIIVVCVSPFQALLFTATTLVMLLPERVTQLWVLTNTFAIAGACVLLVASCLLWPDLIPIWQRLMALGYLTQMVYYTLLYLRVKGECLRRLSEVYDDEMSGRLRWVDVLFFSALLVGILALVWAFVPYTSINVFFIAVTTVYYIFAVAMCVRYPFTERFLIKATLAVQSQKESQQKHTLAVTQPQPIASLGESLMRVEQKVNDWVQAGRCYVADLSVDEIVDEIGISRDEFDQYFTEHLHTHFRTWRIELRMREAARIITETPDISTMMLIECIGYNDRSNFHKHFRQFYGITVSEFRKKTKENEKI